MKPAKEIIKKIITKEIILYVIFGVITTLVNIGTFYFLRYLMKWNENMANLIAIMVAILVAYLTNRKYVFHSKASNRRQKVEELIKFVMARLLTMLLEFFGGLILFETAIPEIVSKICLTGIVIILNYFIIKFFAFGNRKK